MRVIVGGTFSPLHDGHRKLLGRSFELAGEDGIVTIGLTTDSFGGKKSHPVLPYEERKRRLIEFIYDVGFPCTWKIEELSDRYGSAISADFDALMVSEETFPVALEINKIRKELGLKKVDIHQITCVLAEDGRWISSTRIHRGEIDDQGHLLHET